MLRLKATHRSRMEPLIKKIRNIAPPAYKPNFLKTKNDPFNRSQYNSNNSFFNNPKINQNLEHNLKEELNKTLNKIEGLIGKKVSIRGKGLFNNTNVNHSELIKLAEKKIQNMAAEIAAAKTLQSKINNKKINKNNLFKHNKKLINKNQIKRLEENTRKLSNFINKEKNLQKQLSNLTHHNKSGVHQPRNQNINGQPSTCGSRTVHIKGVGKRVVRQTKTGRTYVIVNKKKRYLN